MMERRSFVFFVLLNLLIIGCSTTRNYAPVRLPSGDLMKGEKYYTIKHGDTLFSIGFRYGKHYQQLSKWNNISPPYTLYVGQKIKLFKPSRKVSRRKYINKVRRKGRIKRRASSQKQTYRSQKKRSSSQKTSTFSTKKIKMLKLIWQWPIKKRILKSFSQTGKKGIDIYGKVGQKVKSAAVGKVVYSGSALKGYGNLLIIKHNSQYLSAYANNRRVLVKEGQFVKKGQVIAEVGLVGGKQASLHFEIRKNGKPVNPLNYLPRK